jgi:MurNAc alpha-1-phosphate uridylyltransferase
LDESKVNRSAGTPRTAMVLAAGLGKRMRPITDTIPKPMVRVAGKPLIDWGLDALARAGVSHAVVNVHYLPDPLEVHMARRTAPRVTVSDERALLLDSAGGIVKALPQLGNDPFFIVNADTFWIDGAVDNLLAMAAAYDPAAMDMIILLARLGQATGHSGGLDFLMDSKGRLSRAPKGDAQRGLDGFIYAGGAIVSPAIFAGASVEPHGLNLYFDRLIGEGRLFGHVLDGSWITVGTPDAIAPAEAAVARAIGKAA